MPKGLASEEFRFWVANLMFALIFASRCELWWYRDPAACASYTALSIWSSASRNLLDGDARFGGGEAGCGMERERW